jgi:quinoprotein glucose dehydrogenase
MPQSRDQDGTFARIYRTLIALVVGAIGVVLAVGGLWLILLGGSWYYAVTGVAMVVSAILLMQRRMAGVWLFALIFAATVVWALWERGMNGWAQVPRLLGPAILFVLILFLIPQLGSHRFGRGRRDLAAQVVVSGLAFGTAVLLALAQPLIVTAQTPPAEAAPAITVAADGASGADWLAYGGTTHGTRYSTLDQITPAKVASLEQVWTYRTGDMPAPAAEGKYSPENTPLKVDDRLYVCSAMGIVTGVDAATGQEVWRHDPQVSTEAIPYGATCRGVAYHAGPDDAACATRILWGTLDARLLAVDARTGTPCADFGTGGTVDLNQGIGDTVPGWYAVTSPPTIVRGVAVMGAQVKDGQAEDAPSGVVRGYDVVTGALAWAWDLGNPALTGAPPEGEVYTRGTPNMWTTATGDEALGLVYLPLGNSSVDYYGSLRSAQENEHATALVALDALTGRKVWAFQTVHRDVWDYDLGGQGSLVDFPVDGAPVPALVLPTKQGDIYVLDRRTGAPLTPVEERVVPAGGGGARVSVTDPALFHLSHAGQARPDRGADVGLYRD